MALGSAEVGGGQGGDAGGEAAVDQKGSKRQAFAHRRAGAVQPVKGDAEFAQGEGGADALIEQVTGKNRVQLAGLKIGFFQSAGKRVLLHRAFALFPCFFAPEVVFTQLVKVVLQRTARLHAAADRREGKNGGRIAQGHGLFADSFGFHNVLLRFCLCIVFHALPKI